MVELSCGACSEVSASSDSVDLKQKLLYPYLDRMMAELGKRFSDVSEDLLNGVQACSPASDKFLSEPHLSALALHYHKEVNSEEVAVAKNYIKRRVKEWRTCHAH